MFRVKRQMMTRLRGTFLLRCVRPWLQIVLIAGAGCATGSGPGPARDDSPVQTDAVVYRLRHRPGIYEATAHATYVNRTGRPVYYPRCHLQDDGPTFGYRRTGPDSARALFTDTYWACVDGLQPVVLQPGDRVAFDVRLGSFEQRQMTPPLRLDDIVGRMRIWLRLCARATDTAPCELLPMAERQSNAFDVRW